MQTNHDTRTLWEAWFQRVRVRMTELSEVARRITGKWLNNRPTCLAFTSGESDPIGRSDMECLRDLADKAI